jgi:uncharacterized protein (TIGR00299 family) protein
MNKRTKKQPLPVRICYLDCFSGVSGDMILGALIDAGVPLQKLTRELSRLPLKGYTLKKKKVMRSGFSATKVDVIRSAERRNAGMKRTWTDIDKIIKTSTLSDVIKEQGSSIFRRLFETEAKVHGSGFQNTHLHELGAVDCIVDVFGALIGFHHLGVDEIYASPLNVGGGHVNSLHGILPVPAPATSELLRGVPVFSSHVPFELTTPTGASIVTHLAREFISFPAMTVSHIGVGAGERNIRRHPNVLRLYIGEGRGVSRESVPICVIETNIDDMNPQLFEYVMERLFREGALDVFLTQITMKKGRPGIKLTVLCHEEKLDNLSRIVLEETSSIGLRYYRTERRTLEREVRSKTTRLGKVRVKVSRTGRGERTSPEYEDCKKIAKKHRIPLVEVMKMIESDK